MLELIFATQNKHKAEEIQALMPAGIKILSLQDIGCNDDIPETAPTLEGNAQQKARYVSEKFSVNCFADDTGLEIEALNVEPGVYSARYAGAQRNSNDNMDLVLSKLKDSTNRNAQFRTSICLIIGSKEYFFEGKVQGTIRNEKSGEEGFGYDPIFEPENAGRTFAEMSMAEKSSISHRARAFNKMVAKLAELQKENTIIHQKKLQRFELIINSEVAFIEYQKRDNQFILSHSEVPVSLRGKGVGKTLVAKTFEYLIANDIKAHATCSYIRIVVMRNPKWHSHITF